MATAARQFTRPPLERILEFHNLIQAGKYPNCAMIAAKFEVHLRTVNRDLEFMRDRLGLPLKYDPEHRGFHYTKPVERFPMMPVTESELFALLVAHKAIEQYQGTPFEGLLNTAFKKLAGQLGQEEDYVVGAPDELLSFRPLAPDIADLENFEILTRALKQKRVLKFAYRNLGAKTLKERTEHPYHLACIENRWYMFAFDVERQAMRTFVLARLSDPEITPESFKKPRNFNVNDYLKGAFAVFKGNADYEVVVEFDAWATDLIRGRRWHPTQDMTQLPDGRSRLRMHLDNIEEMVGWVLSWGAHARVIRPVELQTRVQETAKAILQEGATAPAVANAAGVSPAQPSLTGM